MNYALQFYTGKAITPDCRKPEVPQEDDLARLERLARQGGVGVDLSKMSKEEIFKRLLGA